MARGLFMTGVLSGLIACSSSGLPPAPAQTLAAPPSAAEPTTPSAPDQASALEQLAALAVHHDNFARAELYTWTSVEQLRRIRETKVLLSADSTTGGRASPFNQALLELVTADANARSPKAELARVLLEHPALRRRRYAWPSPFATTMGLGKRRYGDSLIRIELDPRARIGRFEPEADPPFSFVDMQGRDLSLEQILAEPERLAALYHVRTPPEAPIAYREFVVCSEAMIHAWSIATPEIRARVEAEIDLLDLLRRETLAQLPRAAVFESAAGDWLSSLSPTSATPLALWHASLAFDNVRYQPSSAQLETIRQTLRGYEDDGGPPLTHRPNPDPAPRKDPP